MSEGLTPIENRVLSLLKERYVDDGWAFSGCAPAEDPALARCAKDGADVRAAIDHLIQLGLVQKRDCQALAFELSPAQRLELIEGYDLSDYWQLSGRPSVGDEYGEILHVRSVIARGDSCV